MRRRLLGHKRGNTAPTYEFEIDENSTFLIRRESDNVEQTFTYPEVIGGTYDSFVSGSNGAVKKWAYNEYEFIQNTNTLQPRLFSGSGSPYIYDYTNAGVLTMSRVVDMSGDWVISVIMEAEENGNNGRMNFFVRGSGNNSFGIMATPYGNADMYIDKVADGSSMTPDYLFQFNSNAGVFNLYTFRRQSGVITAYLNNTQLSLSAGVRVGSALTGENTVLLGNGRADGIGGKTNKYKHFKLLTGEAANVDISAYNQSIMTKYGI